MKYVTMYHCIERIVMKFFKPILFDMIDLIVAYKNNCQLEMVFQGFEIYANRNKKVSMILMLFNCLKTMALQITL
jgi:hypothetical protein